MRSGELTWRGWWSTGEGEGTRADEKPPPAKTSIPLNANATPGLPSFAATPSPLATGGVTPARGEIVTVFPFIGDYLSRPPIPLLITQFLIGIYLTPRRWSLQIFNRLTAKSKIWASVYTHFCTAIIFSSAVLGTCEPNSIWLYWAGWECCEIHTRVYVQAAVFSL